MRKYEIELLKDELFLKRLKNYTHPEVSVRVTEAAMDTDAKHLDDSPWSDDFMDVCENLINFFKKMEG